MPPTPGTPDTELHFRVGPHLDALIGRIERHFADARPDPADDDALVVGIFGPWGCGKTHWLNHVERHFSRRLDQEHESGPSVTVPVFFNAWRYEKEPHLIVPLLKTAERELEKLAQRYADERAGGDSTGPTRWSLPWRRAASPAQRGVSARLRESARALGDTAIALAAGLSGELSVGVAKVKLSGKDVLAEDQRRAALRAQDAADPAASPLGAYEARYYDLHQHLRALTGRSGDAAAEPRINLLFLVDDLDRCLPDKAIEVIEAIKLFLEVESCAFVLALDDEVVERGIRYRYRNYARDGQGAAPITGSEYLEKIVHLPARVPPVSADDARRFLLARYHELFVRRIEKRSDRGREQSELERRASEHTEPGGGNGSDASREETDEVLLALFVRAVPLVPRKLIRAAEMFAMIDRVARQRIPETSYDRRMLARLVLIQLFAPELYRLGSRPALRGYLQLLAEWKGMPIDDIEQRHQPDSDESSADRRVRWEREIQPTFEALKGILVGRSGFDPREVIDDGQEPEQFTIRMVSLYYELVPAEVTSRGEEAAAEEAGRPGAPPAELATAGRLSDAELFVVNATSEEPLDWRNALDAEEASLAGRVLDDATFEKIRERFEKEPERLTVGWLEVFAPVLSGEQMRYLYETTRLLERLGKEESGDPGA